MLWPWPPATTSRPTREVIDRLVRACQEGQGQMAPRRVRTGTWNSQATAESVPDQLAINEAVARMSDGDREAVAGLLMETFIAGVHETLVVLHESQVPPFDDGYEGTPFHDFVGRLGGWPWPE